MMNDHHRCRYGFSLVILLLSILLLLQSPTPVACVSQNEIVALDSMRAAWPILDSLWSGSNSSKACDTPFTGITCSPFGEIREINLRNVVLNGTIPSEIGLLNNLTRLAISNASLSGTLPSSISHMSSLALFSAYDNYLSGSIPSSFGSLPLIEQIDLNANWLNGTIPDSLTALTTLTGLFFQDNNLSGTIPSSIGNLTNLEILYLFNNSLTGTIPTSIVDCTSLTILSLDQNKRLSGSIPAALGKLVNLEKLFLNDANLTGSIPSSITNINSLTVLRLQNNRLSGVIPAIPEMATLTDLDLSNNLLSLCNNSFSFSTIPISRCNLTNQGNVVSCSETCLTDWSQKKNCLYDSKTLIASPCPSPPSQCSSPPPMQSGSVVWLCYDGTWVSQSSVEAPGDLQLSGTGPISIQGNLTVTQSIIFSSPSTSVTVNGCIVINGSVVVEIDESELESLSKSSKSRTLLQSNQTNCAFDINNVPVVVSQKKSCKRASAETQQENENESKQSLNVLFKVDSKSCNTWWIILVSVLGAVVLVSIILVAIFVPKMTTNAKMKK